jgi:hypothetical protein
MTVAYRLKSIVGVRNDIGKRLAGSLAIFFQPSPNSQGSNRIGKALAWQWLGIEAHVRLASYMKQDPVLPYG